MVDTKVSTIIFIVLTVWPPGNLFTRTSVFDCRGIRANYIHKCSKIFICKIFASFFNSGVSVLRNCANLNVYFFFSRIIKHRLSLLV